MPTDWIKKLHEIASQNGSKLKNVVPKAFLLPLVALGVKLADVVAAFFGVPIAMFDAVGQSIGLLVDGVFGGPGRILNAGALESARSLSQGVWAQFGPFSWAVAMGSVLTGAYLLQRYLATRETGNFLPVIPTDVPFLGVDEEEDNA